MSSRPWNAVRTALPVLMVLAPATGLSGLPSAGALESVRGPYTGNAVFKVGDRVEATHVGEWTKAQVVGVDTAAGKYRIHFDGEKYCNNHVLDSWVLKQWVRPVKQQEPARPQDDATPRNDPGRPNTPTGPGTGAGIYKVGEEVLYSSPGVIWKSGAKIEAYDPEKRTYRLRFDSGSGDIVPAYAVARPGGPFDHRFFLGKWDVRVLGAITTSERERERSTTITGGTRLFPLEIKADGTYVWQVEKNKSLRGRWQPRKDAPGIVLINGIDGKSWTLYEKTEGYATTAKTRDEIGFHHLPSSTGYYHAYRIGPNRSSVLVGRRFPGQ